VLAHRGLAHLQASCCGPCRSPERQGSSTSGHARP
jgi:hypothetical protein